MILKLFNFTWRQFGYSLLLAVLLIQSSHTLAKTFQTEKYALAVEVITEQLENPWGLVFLPSGEMLVTERAGALRRVSLNGKLSPEIEGLPKIAEKGQGGLLGLCLDPDFIDNQLIYISYVSKSSFNYGTEVMRARLKGNRLEEQTVIFRMKKKSRGGRHFGSRLVFGSDNKLYVSLGDRGSKSFAQELSDHRGSVVRMNTDGKTPSDNPFIDDDKALPDIYSYGHRNVQGMTLKKATGEIWTHEHGPQGGDEINIVEAGLNYGWPVITYGVNYGIGTRIGEGTHKSGMQQPLYKWVPSIAPSGMSFYSGKVFSGWLDNLFVGSLKFGVLVRLVIKKNKVIHEERMLHNSYGRIRDVVEGPDGLLYLLTDDVKGKILRLRPASGT